MHTITYHISSWQDLYLAIESYVIYYLRISIKEACIGIGCESTYTKGITAAHRQPSLHDVNANDSTMRLKCHIKFLKHHHIMLRVYDVRRQIEWFIDLEDIYDCHLVQAIYPNRFDDQGKPSDDVSGIADPKWGALPFVKQDFNDYVVITAADWNKQRALYPNRIPQPHHPLSSLTHLLKLLSWLHLELYLDCPRQDWQPVVLGKTDELPDRKEKIAIGMYKREEQRRLIMKEHIYHIRLDGKGGIDIKKIPPINFIYILPPSNLWTTRNLDPDKGKPERELPYGLYKVKRVMPEVTREALMQDYNYKPDYNSTTTRYMVLVLEALSTGAPHLTIDVMHRHYSKLKVVRFYTFKTYLRDMYDYHLPPHTYRNVADDGDNGPQ